MLALDQRVVSIRLPLLCVSDVSLLLQGAENRQDGGVRERVAQAVPDFGDSGGARLPQHRHDVQLAIREADLCRGQSDSPGLVAAQGQLVLPLLLTL